MPPLLVAMDRHFPLRYLAWVGCSIGFLLTAFVWIGFGVGGGAAVVFGLGVALGVYDHRQRAHPLWRNYPVIGHLHPLARWVRSRLGDGGAAEPYSRAQQALVERRARGEAETVSFASPHAVDRPGAEWLLHTLTPSPLLSPHDLRVTIGASCRQPYSASLFNISGMDFGSLSAAAVLALNAGARRGGFAQVSGEGGLTRYHRENGGDLIWEIGPGYFGCRSPDGGFDAECYARVAREAQVKMIEVQLNHAASAGAGGVLPAGKVTPEVAALRGVPPRREARSPAAHSAFSTPLELLHFVDDLRALSGGKPVGLKLCVGRPREWFAIAKAMAQTSLVPDFIVIEAAEGGSGAAPYETLGRMGLPGQDGLRLVHNTLNGLGLRERLKLGYSGRVVDAFDIARALALGADFCLAARSFMLALGCVQAARCHTNRCPTGIATQDPWRQRGLVVSDKAERVRHYHEQTLSALADLLQAAGLARADQLEPRHLLRRTTAHSVQPLSELLHACSPGAALTGTAPDPSYQQDWTAARPDRF
ncbi:FMN-binding glutamate synthase family protein [Caldimonas brevitalea]|uniref:Ferredoxin-dependent glutamate synthase n=1 Tax=Caldimonas brevitalea TaxID=413882 RepID=A0A0G3BG41_9BURK|nr:FMN-binding glutamate synthase family protein [Caldimonas brevitalea]AKJ26933.1 ferredoxin-dependent glutamate synthase [Caldimonas brevitalea]